jgi:hypothetical protein
LAEEKMKNPFFNHSKQQPVPSVWVLRVLVVLLVLTALLAGYYYTVYGQLRKEYRRLENTKLELIEIPTEEIKE